MINNSIDPITAFVANLIADMALKGASVEELDDAINFSVTLMDMVKAYETYHIGKYVSKYYSGDKK